MCELRMLTDHHATRCEEYQRILQVIGRGAGDALSSVPFLPVSLFKTHHLSSVPAEDEFKVLTSSGTTGQQVSRVILDREAAQMQSLALARIMSTVIGPKRLPMIVVDTPNLIKDRTSFSARGAAVLGMAQFGRQHLYVLRDDMSLDLDGLLAFLDRHHSERILVFGFTYMVWKYFLAAIRENDVEIDLRNAILVHSGGWKRLLDESISDREFKQEFRRVTGLEECRNFYGMIEQIGSVFLEGMDGYLYAPNFADVVVRDPMTLEEMPDGTPGVVEVVSALPRSYPGHALLTEDLGVAFGAGESPEGWLGRKIRILGRIPRSDIRGCSDTHIPAA